MLSVEKVEAKRAHMETLRKDAAKKAAADAERRKAEQLALAAAGGADAAASFVGGQEKEADPSLTFRISKVIARTFLSSL